MFINSVLQGNMFGAKILQGNKFGAKFLGDPSYCLVCTVHMGVLITAHGSINHCAWEY